jgi:hypothetical protein
METILFEHEVSLSRILQSETIRSDEVEPPLILRRICCSSGHPPTPLSLSLARSLARSSHSAQAQLWFCTIQWNFRKAYNPFSLRGGMGPPAQRKERETVHLVFILSISPRQLIFILTVYMYK